MKSYSAMYMKAANLEELQERSGGQFQKYYSKARQVPGTDWVLAEYSPDDYPPDDEYMSGEESLVLAKSEIYGELIYLYGDFSYDLFAYEHVRDGEMLRKLVWCSGLDPELAEIDDESTPGWLCVEGEPESWEAAILFSPADLERQIEREKDMYAYQERSDNFPAREARLRQAWETRTISPQTTFPFCDGTVAIAVEEFLGLKHAF